MEEQAKFETDVKKWDDRHPEEKAVAVSGNSPASMMIAAISKGMDLEKLEKFMELQERWEKNEAKKAYTEAMAAFKKSPPKIGKDRHVKFQTAKGTTEYDHASLANVTEKINAALGEQGLSAAWITIQTGKEITVTCTITHKMGHSESTSLTAAPDDSGSKNAIQAIGSTISYLQRYTILALTGLATADMDDNGKLTEPQYITPGQVKEIEKKIKEVDADRIKFFAYMGAASVEAILATDYNKAMTALKAKEKSAKTERAKKDAPLFQERQPGEDDDKG